MKITKIERDKDSYNVFIVTFTPNFFEKLFGVKEKNKKFKDTDSIYTFGGGTVYISQDGEKIENRSYIGESIDKWRRAF